MDETASTREPHLGREQRLHFRNEFRRARAAVLADAEAFREVLFAIERLGQYLCGRQEALGRYGPVIRRRLFPKGSPNDDVDILWGVVTDARNQALHQGAAARHLSQNCVKLALLIEQRLLEACVTVSEFMVESPTCAHLWQPLSFLRRAMLANSYSYLPTITNGRPRLVSDLALARYLRGPEGRLSNDRLSQTLETAIANGLEVIDAVVIGRESSVHEAISAMNGLIPAIVMAGENQMFGIVTPFDLL